MSKITVVLKTAQGSFQLEKGEYTLDANGRLPLKKIMEDWNVKGLRLFLFILKKEILIVFI